MAVKIGAVLIASATQPVGPEIFGIPLTTLLGLSVLGAVVTALGSLLGILVKDVWAANWFENRKTKRTIEDVYRRYQLPIFLAAKELNGRLFGLAEDGSIHLPRESEFGLERIGSTPARGSDAAVSDHYLRYRFLSHIYRLCGFLGWVELYRRDIGTMDFETLGLSRTLETALANIQSALADGQLNQRDDWSEWRDCLLFREELRAIGSRMIADKDKLAILDFATFTEIVEADPTGNSSGRWFVQAAHFFEHLRLEKDFRLVRMRMLVVHLNILMELLQPGRIPRAHVEGRAALANSVDALAGGKKWRGQDVGSYAAIS